MKKEIIETQEAYHNLYSTKAIDSNIPDNSSSSNNIIKIILDP